MAGYDYNIEYYMAWRNYLMEATQYIKWSDEAVTKYKYSNHSKEELLNEVYYEVAAERCDIEDVLDALEEHGYIKFKKEPKEYKVFVKIVTIGGEKKKTLLCIELSFVRKY